MKSTLALWRIAAARNRPGNLCNYCHLSGSGCRVGWVGSRILVSHLGLCAQLQGRTRGIDQNSLALKLSEFSVHQRVESEPPK